MQRDLLQHFWEQSVAKLREEIAEAARNLREEWETKIANHQREIATLTARIAELEGDFAAPDGTAFELVNTPVRTPPYTTTPEETADGNDPLRSSRIGGQSLDESRKSGAMLAGG